MTFQPHVAAPEQIPGGWKPKFELPLLIGASWLRPRKNRTRVWLPGSHLTVISGSCLYTEKSVSYALTITGEVSTANVSHFGRLCATTMNSGEIRLSGLPWCSSETIPMQAS